MSSDSSIGRAKLWRCLGYKFKSYFEQIIKVVMELVDMNSLGLFDFFILSVQVGSTL
jgi:hypothetical protein